MTFIGHESMSILRIERKGGKRNCELLLCSRHDARQLGTSSSHHIFFYSTLYPLGLITVSDTQYVIQYICVLFKSGKGDMERSMLDNNLFI